MPRLIPLPKMIVIVGPTASGKTDLAIKLAKKFGGEIVSADSRQIYRGMDIGTAKPLPSQLFGQRQSRKILNKSKKLGGRALMPYISESIPHHLIDIRNPNQPYNLARYQRDAIAAIRKILKKKKLPILVGGTGLYVKAVVDNLDLPKAKPNLALRRNLESRIKNQGVAALYQELVKLDPEAAYIIDPKNPRRVIRALEITIATGVPFSKQRQSSPPTFGGQNFTSAEHGQPKVGGKPLFESLQIGIAVPKDKLEKRIEQRVEEMTNDGLFREVKKLIKKYSVKCQAFDAIGYREVIAYLHGKISKPETVEQIKKNTWQFAKRQLTWFKKDKRIKWVKTQKEALELTKQFLE